MRRNTKENGHKEKTMHVFEKAGLGTAPFRVVGFEIRTYQACQGAPVQVGGSCDFCGTGIKETFIIEDSERKRFKVDNRCVMKTNDKYMILQAKAKANKIKREQRHVREAAKIEACREMLKDEKIRKALAAEPHPNDWRNAQGDTRLDWADWMMRCAGNAGKLRVAKKVAETALEIEMGLE